MKNKLKLTLVISLFLFHFLSAQTVELVEDFTLGTGSSFDEGYFTILGSTDSLALFTLRGNPFNTQLWASNGQASESELIAQFSGSFLYDFIPYKNEFILLTITPDQYQIWRTDGTTPGTFPFHVETSEISKVTIIEDYIYFSVDNPGGSSVLKRFDIILDFPEEIYDFEGPDGILDMVAFDENKLAVLGRTSTARSLFISDATTNETEEVFEINTGEEEDHFNNMIAMEDKFFFFYNFPNSSDPYKLYVSDGSNEGTIELAKFDFIPDHRADRSSFVFNNNLFFKAEPHNSNFGEARLFTSDGTIDGTFFLDPNPNEYLAPSQFTVYNNELYFKGDFCCSTFGIFKTDGTLPGTSLQISGQTLGLGGNFLESDLLSHNGFLVFNGIREETGSEIWISDGTETGTQVIDFIEGEEGISPQVLTSSDNFLYFTGTENATGTELYKLDTEGEVTSLEIIEDQHAINISPNPIDVDQSNLVCNFSGFDHFKNCTINIYNSQGQFIQTQKIDPTQEVQLINLPSLNSGLYFINFNLDNKKVLTKKFVVMD